MVQTRQTTTRYLFLLVGVLIAVFALPARAADPGDADLAAAAAPPNGLVVQVGASDGTFLSGLTLGGKRLVQGLVMDDATRGSALSAVMERGMHPFATAAVWTSRPDLPYADHLVTLLIVDRDALGNAAPSPKECLRVVEPGGTILTKSAGSWSAAVTPRPEGHGDWTHFDGGPDGNALSTDTQATGIRGLQWIDNVREVRWSKSGPHGGEGGNARILGRYCVIEMRIFPEDKDPKFPRRSHLECRDVHNGLLIWQRDRPWGVSGKRWSLAVGGEGEDGRGGRCFTWLADDGPLSAIDLASGEVVATFPGSEIKPYLQDSHTAGEAPKVNRTMQGDNYWVRVAGDKVIANGDGAVRAWTLDGEPLWTYQQEGMRFEEPTVSLEHGLVYGLMVDDQPVNKWGKGVVKWGRWSSSESVRELVALDLKTGKLTWRNTDVASRDTDIELYEQKEPVRIGFGQLLVTGNYLIAYNSNAIAGGERSFLASIDARTGKTIHFDPRLFVSTNKHGRTLMAGGLCVLARDGLVYVMYGMDVQTFNPTTGELKKVFKVNWNARCHKPIATTTDLLLGQTAFIGDDYSGEMVAVARSGCAMSPVPGGGVIVFGPHTCACTTHFDGFLATTSVPAPPPVADAERLVTLPATPTRASLANADEAAAPDSLVSESWPWYTISTPVDPVTVEMSGWSFRIDPQAHRLDASGGDTRWTFTGDARLSTTIAVIGDRVVVAGHDGWVHGLDLATGAPRWRYLAAPAYRLIVANAMLTSAWPTMGVADLGDGTVVVAAGTHPELDGGVRVVALAANDGQTRWVKNLHKTPSRITPGGDGTQIADRSFINAPPTFKDGKVTIFGGSHLGRFEFAPGDSEASLNERLAQ